LKEGKVMASTADILVEHEKETWALIRRKDLEKFASYLAEDFYDIFPDGEEPLEIGASRIARQR
jgi:hypothetical protein